MTYTPDIPQSGETLGGTRARINDNFQQIDTVVAVNHVAFNLSGEGKHKFLQMPVQSSAPSAASSEIAVYVKDDSSNVAQLFLRGEATGSEYQLTHLASGVDAEIATFGTNTEYDAGPPSLKGGWTFLPGTTAMLMQYGSVTSLSTTSGNPTTVTFSRAFSAAPFSINISFEKGGNSPTTDNAYIKNGTITTTQFEIVTTDSSQRIGYWMAIGPA